METAKAHLSISQLNMMSRCGEQYRRRYIVGEKIPPGISLIVGTAVDRTVTANLQRKLDQAPLMPEEEVRDVAAKEFDAAFGCGEILLTPEEMAAGLEKTAGSGKDKSIRLASLHAREFAPAIQPTHLQREVRVELTGYPYDLLGYIDIQEGRKAVRDTKTSGKTPAANIAEKDDQLTVYAMMVRVIDGAIPEMLTLDYLCDLKTPKAAVFATTRTEEDFRPVLHRIEAAAVALEKGVFIPARESDWWCDPRWCGYHADCKYVKRGKRPEAA